MSTNTHILTPEQTQYIFEFLTNLHTAAKGDAAVFEPNLALGHRTNNTVIVIDSKGAPSFPFDVMAVLRIDTLIARYKMVSPTPVVRVTTAERTREGVVQTYVKLITMEGHGTTVEFRCAHPNIVQIYRTFNDRPAFEIAVPSQTLSFIKSAISAADSQTVKVSISKTSVKYSTVDVTGDELSHTAPAAKVLSDAAQHQLPIEYTYDAKTFLELFKAADMVFRVTESYGFIVMKSGTSIIYMARKT